MIKILTSRSEIEPYQQDIQDAGDSERNSFGFLMPGAYRDFVRQRRAVIAICTDTDALVGYVLYGGAFPQAKIFQTYVSPDFRGQKVGQELLKTVFSRLEAVGYLSVLANVASDLTEADRFYENIGFDLISTKAGGKTRQRLINVRARELSTPSLLDFLEQPSSAVHSIAFRAPYKNRSPLYIVDLNVVFDVVRERPRSEVAQGVISSAMENGVRVAITDELIAELEKHSFPNKPDPILGLCKALPRLRLPASRVISEYRQQLLPIVFPDKTNFSSLKKNDEADLRHLITAIQENAQGFITSDTAILRASTDIEKMFGLSILSPSTFGQGFAVEYGDGHSTVVSTGTANIERHHFSNCDSSDLDSLFSKFHLSDQLRLVVTAAGTSNAPRRREIVRSNGQLICFASWEAPTASYSERKLHLYANESHEDAPLAISSLIETACRDIGHQSVAIFLLETLARQHLIRATARTFGFHPENTDNPRNSVLRKAVLGRAILPEQWDNLKSDLKEALGITISGPLSALDSRLINILDIKDKQTKVSLMELEELLGPSILCASDRAGVILPIWPSYAEELFHGTKQPSFLDHNSAIIKPTKAYIGGHYDAIPEGGLAFFYESSKQNGRKAIIAVARILKRYALTTDQVKSISSDRGVFSEKSIDASAEKRSLKTVIDIGSVMLFSTPISLNELRQIGCADGANFITSKSIEPKHCIELIRAGEPYLG